MRAMKDSGVEWIGKIPEAWDIVQARRYVSVNHGSDPKTPGSIPVYGSGSISFKTCGEYKEGPTVLLGRKGTLNAPQYITGKYWNVDTAFDVAVTDDIALRFYYYLATCFDYMYYSSQTAVPSMTQSNYLSMRLPVPHINVQNCIVNLLNTKCVEIDKVVEQTCATIEEYKKLKQAIITEAVTKGVRGARPMKPSGVEWIGDIPEEWRVTKIRKVCANQISDGTHATPEYATQDDGFPFLSSKDVRKGYIDWSGIKYITQKTHEQIKRNITPQVGDVLLSKNGSIGFSAVVEDEREFDIYVTLALLRPNSLILTKYLKYTLDCESTQKQFSLHLIGIGVLNLHLHVIQNTKILIPPIEEQQEIAAYLDTKCAEIDCIIEKKEQLIEELGSYKKSLIYEYVTGKKEVKTNMELKVPYSN